MKVAFRTTRNGRLTFYSRASFEAELLSQFTATTTLAMDSLLQALESFKEKAQDALFALTSCACQPEAKIKVNGRSFKILRILGGKEAFRSSI